MDNNKLTKRRKEFNEKYQDLNEIETQKELLYSLQLLNRRLERIRTDTSKLVWFLIAIPIIVGVLIALFID